MLDVSRDDLQALISATQLRSYERRLAQVRCADVMARELVTVEFGTPLQEAWSLLRTKGVKALPVVDKWMHLVGIVTLADFMRAADLDLHRGFDERLRDLIRTTPGTRSNKPEVVGQIMTRKVRVTRVRRPLADLLPLLADTGHHHIPVSARTTAWSGWLRSRMWSARWRPPCARLEPSDRNRRARRPPSYQAYDAGADGAPVAPFLNVAASAFAACTSIIASTPTATNSAPWSR